MASEPETYSAWVKQMKHFGGGWHGGLVTTLTVLGTPFLAYYGVSLFPPGTYSRIFLAIPGLALATILFFMLSALFWPLKKRHGSLK